MVRPIVALVTVFVVLPFPVMGMGLFVPSLSFMDSTPMANAAISAGKRKLVERFRVANGVFERELIAYRQP